MFNILRRNRSVVAARLPEAVDTEVSQELATPETMPTLPALIPVASNVDDTESPPSSPGSDTTSDPSPDDPSTEEPTVAEVCKVIVTVAEANTTNDVEPSSDETPDTEEGVSDTDDEDDEAARNLAGYRIYSAWLIFWTVALVGGVLGYYMSTHQDMIALRIGSTNDEFNLLLMPREKWDESKDILVKPSSYVAQRVVIVQTDTEACDTVTACTKLLNALKRQEGIMKYNFLLATDGCIYEALGWQEPSPLYPEVRTMVVAFIGDYEMMAPSTMQLSQLQSLLEASEELRYLTDSYTIVGRKQTTMPSKLFAYLSALQHWDKENSDSDDEYIEVEFDPFPMFDD